MHEAIIKFLLAVNVLASKTGYRCSVRDIKVALPNTQNYFNEIKLSYIKLPWHVVLCCKYTVKLSGHTVAIVHNIAICLWTTNDIMLCMYDLQTKVNEVGKAS